MLRQLFTVFAVLAGLTAAVEPVQARTAGVEAVRLAEVANPSQAQVVPIAQHLAETRQAEPVPAPLVRAVPQFTAPTVIVRVDRARE